MPGYLRVDAVHQGDREKQKGMYHINIVDEVTQWEYIGAVENQRGSFSSLTGKGSSINTHLQFLNFTAE